MIFMSSGNIRGIGKYEDTTQKYIVTILFDPNNNSAYNMNCRFISSEAITNYTQLVDYCSRCEDVYNEKGIMVDGFYKLTSNNIKILMYLKYTETSFEQDWEKRLDMQTIGDGDTLNQEYIGMIAYRDWEGETTESFVPAIFKCEKL